MTRDASGWPALKCYCGHQARWHRNGIGKCTKFACECRKFVEKPLTEIEDA